MVGDMSIEKGGQVMTNKLEKKFRRILLTVKASEREKEYLKALREWEKSAKKKNAIISGPIKC